MLKIKQGLEITVGNESFRDYIPEHIIKSNPDLKVFLEEIKKK